MHLSYNKIHSCPLTALFTKSIQKTPAHVQIAIHIIRWERYLAMLVWKQTEGRARWHLRHQLIQKGMSIHSWHPTSSDVMTKLHSIWWSSHLQKLMLLSVSKMPPCLTFYMIEWIQKRKHISKLMQASSLQAKKEKPQHYKLTRKVQEIRNLFNLT